MSSRKQDKKDFFILPINAKEVLFRLEYRKMTPTDYAFYNQCCCFALTHENRLTLSDLKEYGLPTFPDRSKYDELWFNINHLLERYDESEVYGSKEAASAFARAHKLTERSKSGNAAKKIKAEQHKAVEADEFQKVRKLIDESKEKPVGSSR